MLTATEGRGNEVVSEEEKVRFGPALETCYSSQIAGSVYHIYLIILFPGHCGCIYRILICDLDLLRAQSKKRKSLTGGLAVCPPSRSTPSSSHGGGAASYPEASSAFLLGYGQITPAQAQSSSTSYVANRPLAQGFSSYSMQPRYHQSPSYSNTFSSKSWILFVNACYVPHE